MIPTEREIDQIAEYADASVRGVTRRGSLAPIRGRHGVNAWLYAKWGNRGNAIYTFTGGLLTIALSGVIAWLVEEPLVFPSLGATAFLFFETPMAEVASPRNTIIGHGVGAAIAYCWLVVFGLTDAPSALEAGFTLQRAAAVALSVGCTGGILRLLRAAHPPAGATTVIVSAGLLTTGEELLVLAAGVALLTLTAARFNRALGVPAPRWAARPGRTSTAAGGEERFGSAGGGGRGHLVGIPLPPSRPHPPETHPYPAAVDLRRRHHQRLQPNDHLAEMLTTEHPDERARRRLDAALDDRLRDLQPADGVAAPRPRRGTPRSGRSGRRR